jgi:GTPase-associated adaptor domain
VSAGHLSSGHRLVYRFFSLPYSQRVAVVQGLGLLEPEDTAAPELERFRRCFQRARDRGALAALWGQVEALHPDGDTSSNPFGAS